jgi:NitT/TauT family transport system substrate-binding protein
MSIRGVSRVVRGLALVGALAMLGGVRPVAAQSLPEVKISYWDHSAPSQETVIATQPALLKQLRAKPTWIPIEASPPAIAAMKAGSFDFITGVGNPPVVSGIAASGDFKVIWLGSLDYVQLVVKKSITAPNDLAGKTIVDLIGSSEDYAFRGWLKVNHLQNKVNVLGLAGMETPVAAFKAGRIDGAYVDYAAAREMVQDGGHVLVDSVRIAKLGYAGINVTIVRTAFAQQHPDVVQGYVCAAVAATKLIEDPSKSVRDGAFKAAAALTGQPVEEAIATGEEGVSGADVKLGDEWSYFADAHGNVAGGGIVRNYLQTVSFLVDNGKIPHTLTAQQILPHIDTSYVRKALAGQC